MTEKLQEVLSAAVDDEVTVFEMRRLLHEMDKEPEMREKWARYHLVRNIIEHSASRARKPSPRLESESMDWRALAQKKPPDWDGPDAEQEPRLNNAFFLERKNRKRIYGVTGTLSAVALALLVWWGSPTLLPTASDPIVTSNPAPADSGPFDSKLSSTNEIPPAPTLDRVGNVSFSLTESQIRRLENYLVVHSHQQSLTRNPNPKLGSYVKLVAQPPRSD